MINLLTVEGDLINRCEMFDEADLDAALARFDELSRPTPRLENAASRAHDRFQAGFAARDWDAVAEIFADDISTDDRRRVVNAGLRHGRDAAVAWARATADIGSQDVTTTVIATRGERLELTRARYSGRDHGTDAFLTEVLVIAEINADNRIAAIVVFDLDDIKTAVEELDARYLADEAAVHSHLWSVIARAYAAMNRHELPAATPDWETVDHRRGIAFAPGDMTEIIRSGWEVAPDATNYIEAVHRLSDLGAVFTHAAYGTSPDGFAAEWRMVVLLTADGEPINRCEIFDEADIDAALARFDELSQPAPRLENAATRVYQRLQEYFLARDWDALTETLAEDHYGDDRRSVVNAGIQRGRDAELASLQATADMGVTDLTITPIAVRGDRLALCRTRGTTNGPDAFYAELLRIVEINADNQMAARIVFDLNDIDAAFEELDARYLAGEAAAYAHTWSLIAQTYAAFNRHELSRTSPDWVNIDHRRGIGIRARRHARECQCPVGGRAGHQHPH